ncbi:MAG TPA: hypothetical protein VJK54_01535 [Chthoniobacterales bacterium]|nr:hypothetical protein [Chthoniobacterales bacterium]
MYLHYTFAAQSFGSDPSSEGGDLNAYEIGYNWTLMDIIGYSANRKNRG